ncbi:MAG: transcriptional regulator [Comamonas sp. SCN 65-56]|uniref:ArsR/SmtB family transcription factor n=1 Tax=Comamonas sp. SCN 65-56 TaxID=1660095 RepID=UPI00086B8F45|nr:metalloregulator ArsR/SmtB family transcription factor [Comamonas sp. SCN 65-56]ODS90420.1 MAG: transcriptional regulator [Comamonas sp. SCN 65-56]
MKHMPPQVIDQVAAYFQVLSEPTRLRLLNLLREREYNVGELAQACGYTAATVSRHLSLMTKHGIVAREERGPSVYFRIADERVDALCDLVCGSIASRLQAASEVHDAFKALL